MNPNEYTVQQFREMSDIGIVIDTIESCKNINMQGVLNVIQKKVFKGNNVGVHKFDSPWLIEVSSYWHQQKNILDSKTASEGNRYGALTALQAIYDKYW
jgi:hypothetical protein